MRHLRDVYTDANVLTREMTFENVIFLFIASDGYKRRHVWSASVDTRQTNL